MADQISVTIRDESGTRSCRRLRQEGIIPAILYGHGKPNVKLSVSSSDLYAAIRHGSQMLEMIGAVSDTALIRDVQWDAFGTEVLHLDLTRVSAEEAVEVTVPVELRGEAPGMKEGGIVEHNLHEVEISCPAGSIPEKLEANINELHLGQSILVSQLELPSRASLITAEDSVVASCSEPTVEADEEVGAAAAGEPEVIGRQEEEEEGEN